MNSVNVFLLRHLEKYVKSRHVYVLSGILDRIGTTSIECAIKRE